MAVMVSRRRKPDPGIRRSSDGSFLFCNRAAYEVRGRASTIGRPADSHYLIGFSIVLGAAITAPPRAQSPIIYRAAHLVLLYMIWLILAADYAKHPIKSLRLVAILVVIALVLRHLPQRHTTKRDSSHPAASTRVRMGTLPRSSSQ